ncbi:non-ribosomal peptide synthetase [Psychromicrobium lacuslunae]|uniref:Carrier domain-containing protein n=1 Tax=Psychromicrobium lacuslunae TaxID=1618207 RepID=A0A0D4C2A6_9MICC|nr:non-ribosomal peptide synthetase [Psychromicrobium lacuslunae]AJT42515.1 hypothetical protein UM93_15295 [Psychromicrobium lacuslunae]
MNDLSTLISRLPDQRREDLLRRLASARAEKLKLVRRRPGAETPASLQQQWFVDQTHRDNTGDRFNHVWTLFGSLDLEVFRAALDIVMARHESLRTSMAMSGIAELSVVEAKEFPLSYRDLSAEKDPEASFRILADEVQKSSFDLQRPPLFKAALVRMSPQEHRFLLTVHHFIWDTASANIFWRELSASVKVILGVEQLRAESAINYRDYAVWQRTAVTKRKPSLTQWWRSYLEGVEATELPGDRPRQELQNRRAAALNGTLAGKETLSDLAKLCTLEGTNLFAGLAGIFAHLLGRWTGSDEVTFGAPFDLRVDERLRDCIGHFSNMLPLRCDTGNARTLREQIGVTRDLIDAVKARQDLPFNDIVAAINPKRDPGRTPLFQIELALQESHPGQQEPVLPGVTVSPEINQTENAEFDFSLLVQVDTDRLRFILEYNTEIYDRQTMEAFSTSIITLIAQAVATPNAPLESIELIDESEKAILEELGDGGPKTGDWNMPVPEIILNRAKDYPQAVAVSYADRNLEYGELVARASSVAARLGQLGVGPGDRVLLVARPSDEAIVGILGILLLGATYVPLDPDLPVTRARHIADQAQAAAWLLDSVEVTKFSDLISVPRMTISSAESVDLVVNSHASAEGSAYVIFTSGTTGRPKGVEIDHTALAHFCGEIRRAYSITNSDRVLGFARLNFDVSVFEIFATLSAGATLCIPELPTRRDPVRLQNYLDHEKISVAELPPALLPLLSPTLSSLRLISVGGEPFSGQLVKLWSRDREFWNGYGPTESTVAITLKQCAGDWSTNPPIGRPLPGARARVIDSAGRLVPRGCVGELMVTGPTVALGYFRDETQTKRAFDESHGERSFRTGDLVRWRSDGELDFIGRRDRQVKVNGFRIELSEVEHALLEVDVSSQVVAKVVKAEGLGQVLVAFVTPHSDQQADPMLLRAEAAKKLPPYAVPARIICLQAIPLTSSGKVDHRALDSALELDLQRGRGAMQSSRELSSAEHHLAVNVFCPILAISELDPDAGFFELGGNSLQATQVTALVEQRLGIKISILELFQNSSVRALSSLIESHRSGESSSSFRGKNALSAESASQ